MCWKWATCTSHSFLLRYLSHPPPAFFAIIDLLAVLPYYIEVALHEDTVRPLPREFSDKTNQSTRPSSSVSPSSVLSGSSVSSGHLNTKTKCSCASSSSKPHLALTLRSTIEVMYIAIHRSKDALLALAFFIAMALVVFSTLIYFAERGVWDGTLGTFVDAEGGPCASAMCSSQANWGIRRESLAVRVDSVSGVVCTC